MLWYLLVKQLHSQLNRRPEMKEHKWTSVTYLFLCPRSTLPHPWFFLRKGVPNGLTWKRKTVQIAPICPDHQRWDDSVDGVYTYSNCFCRWVWQTVMNHFRTLEKFNTQSQYITIYHNISQYITIYHNISQYITIYHNISQWSTRFTKQFAGLRRLRDNPVSSCVPLGSPAVPICGCGRHSPIFLRRLRHAGLPWRCDLRNKWHHKTGHTYLHMILEFAMLRLESIAHTPILQLQHDALEDKSNSSWIWATSLVIGLCNIWCLRFHVRSGHTFLKFLERALVLLGVWWQYQRNPARG